MNECVFCKEQVINNICESCLGMLRKDDYDITEQEYFETKNIDDLYYTLIKIDDYFQEAVEENNQIKYHKIRVKCLHEILEEILKLNFNLTEIEIDLFFNNNLKTKNIDDKIIELQECLYLTKEDLSWSWFQFMEIHFIDLYKFIDKNIIFEKLNKYFEKEICLVVKPKF